jgi:adenosine deaminase
MTFRHLPKVSLHVHLTGSVDPKTVMELAAAQGVSVGRSAETLYDIDAHEDLDEFLRVYDLIGAVIVSAADFARVTYETLALAASHGVLYREMFISPSSHAGVPYRVQLDGILAGMREARADHGIDCRLIVALNRERSAAEAVSLVETVIAERVDEVIGIGLDYAEVYGPPERFADAFRLAGTAGLHRTAHSETGPPANIVTMLDLLGCSRVDHGYHVVTDPAVTRRCVDEGIVFTCTPVSSDIGRYSGSGDGSHRRIREMVDAGLAVAIDSDDPPMFGTDPTRDWQVLSDALGYREEQLLRFTRTAIDGCWLDDVEKKALHDRADQAIAAAHGGTS